MVNFVKSIGRRLRAVWFLPLILLAVPNCALQTHGIAGPSELEAGPLPHTSAIMCDIPKVPDPGSTGCANSTETGIGMSFAHAAVALAQGEQSSIGLDLSSAAEAACGGLPKKIDFQGPFPDGFAVCLNCATQVPAVYADANAVCVDECIDLVNGGGAEPAEGVEEFCTANAHVSTNFDANTCFDDACSDGGTLLPGFVDPRRAQEPVIWTDLIGTSPAGNDLSRDSMPDGSFDAGAASKQAITQGDGWVEFEATENDKGHVVGLAPDVGPDTDPSQADVAFGIRLGAGGNVVIVEDGSPSGPSVGPYDPGDRFRVQIKDNLDGTASVSYFKLSGPCTPGTICNGAVIGTSAASAKYPLRVDASLADVGATLKNVTLVRIK